MKLTMLDEKLFKTIFQETFIQILWNKIKKFYLIVKQ